MFLFKCNIFLKFLFLALIGLVCANIKISDKRLCADDKCKVPVSEGTTLIRFSRPSKNILSFGPNEKVTIFSKSAGSNPNLWGVEINGKRGYIPKDAVREKKILKKPTKLVDTEFKNDSPTIEVPSKGPKQTETVLSPEPVKELYEVIDGTKVPVDVGAFSKENGIDKLTDSSSNPVESDKNKGLEEKVLKETTAGSTVNEENDANEAPDGIISAVLSFLTSDDDKDKEHLDVTVSHGKKEENNEEEEEEDEDDEDDDDSDGDENDNDDDDDDEEMESKENDKLDSIPNMSEVQPKLEINDEKNSSNTGQNNLQFNEESLGTKNNETENLEEKNIEKKTAAALKKTESKSEELSNDLNITNNLTQTNINILNSENQESIKKENDSESKDNSLNIALSKNVEDKKQEENNVIQQAESVLGVDHVDPPMNNFVQQNAIDLEKALEVNANKNSETKPKLETSNEQNSSSTGRTLLQFNEQPLDTKNNETENLEKIVLQKNNIKDPQEKNVDKSEELSNDLSNVNNFTTANADSLNSENQEFIKMKEDIESEDKSPNITSPLNEEIKDKTGQQTENVLKKEPEKISDADVNNSTVKKENLIGNENIEKKLSKEEEIEKNKLDDSFDSRKAQKDDSSEKSFELKETQKIETSVNTNNNIELQNISETSTENIQKKLTQNTQENLTQSFHEYLSQNSKEESTQNSKEDLTLNSGEYLTLNSGEDLSENAKTDFAQTLIHGEKSPDEISTTDSNNKNNYLNFPNDDSLLQSSSIITDNSYKDSKSESSNIPESFSVHSEEETKDDNLNTNQKLSNEIYRSLHESSLLIHKNKDNQLTEHEASSTSGTEQGNDFCLESENAEDCALDKRDSASGNDFFQETIMEFLLNLPNDVVSTVLITGLTTILFLLGYIYIDKSSRIRPLIAKINKLEKALLIAEEENKIGKEKLLEEQNDIHNKPNDGISSDIFDSLQQQLDDALMAKTSLEEQIVNLERELENSTEVGLELNRMLSDFLSSQDSDVLVANIEQLQRQLVEQQGTINSYSETLNVKETEIHELRLELEISNSKLTDLQKENERTTANLLKIEEEKYELQNKLESEVNALKKHIEQLTISSTAQINKLSDELKLAQKKAEESQRNAELKTKEYNLLKENTLKLKTLKDEDLSSLLDVASFKAELELLSKEKHLLLEHCKQSDEVKDSFEKQYEKVVNDMQSLQRRYDEADREKLEAQTKLEVLENYFKEREANLQKELAKHEAMFMEKQGETYSITEKIKFMQEELQNYKAQNDSLKQEIVEQEVQMKSQISLLEKRVHENWVNARQAERKLEEAKQEAAQLRNRLTIRERTLHEEKYQNRLKSPAEQNGELPVSPTPASPPLLFGARDLTTSPPLQGLPPPFLPPPPFMPPPMPGGVPPPFMPPPSSMPPLQAMFPSDRRPAPLGRMSSPPIDSRYSPDSRAYSPYSRNSPSPTSDDDYCHSPPPLHRGYSPINNRESKREYRRSPGANKVSRNHKGSMHSSGSANSNESLEKIARKPSKV